MNLTLLALVLLGVEVWQVGVPRWWVVLLVVMLGVLGAAVSLQRRDEQDIASWGAEDFRERAEAHAEVSALMYRVAAQLQTEEG